MRHALGSFAQRRVHALLLCAAAIAIGPLGCGSERDLHGEPDAATCSRCHGGPDNAAPPLSVNGKRDASDAAVGAHQAHLRGTALRAPLACSDCHVVPEGKGVAGHIDGRALVTFGALARTGGASPTWTRDTGSCSATYCHGGTLGGGALTAPVWNRGAGEAACGACHGLPPPPPHVQNPDCGRCHLGYTAGSVVAATHVDGKVDVKRLECNGCHGSATSVAPPIGTAGETATTDVAVGAHEQHLRGGTVRARISCSECHVLPFETLHADGDVDLAWGRLASADGAAPSFDPATATCSSTYCHGATLALGDGTVTAPVWTRVGEGEASCGTCHAAPPGFPHPSRMDCSRCHPGTTTADDSRIDVAGGQHIDGILDIVPVTCTMCHGTEGVNPAPPVGTRGETETSSVAVGAHQKHVQDGRIRKALGCVECHVYPAIALHANGTVDLAWGALASGDGAKPEWTRTSATCSSTYCHGATLSLGGWIAKAPIWTAVSAGTTACNSCHGFAPPLPHPQNTSCNRCHEGTVLASGAIDVAGGQHIDGTVQVSAGGCTACHGTDGANPAPPVGTKGETLTTQRAVGAHQKHVVDGAIRKAFECGDCHAPVTDLTHVNGDVSLPFTGLASQGTTPSWTGTSCSSTYCHGATLAAGGSNPTPTWTVVSAGPTGCGSCHGAPPTTGGHPQSADCAACHPETVNPDGTIDVAGGRHIDGAMQVAGGCSLCHGSEANPAPPTGTEGETATTARAVGAHQAHVRDGALRRALSCDACHQFSDATHRNGVADVEWGTLATTGGTVPRFEAATATCAATYCHGATLGAGGTLVTPIWTKVDGSQAACGTCHGNPPTIGHPNNPSCKTCHPATVAADGKIDLAGGKHINGAVEVAGGACNVCHGSDVNAAPPLGTGGETDTSARAVGAHQAHVRGGTLRAAMSCDECHQFADATHMNGVADLTFGTLATSGGAIPRFDGGTATCASTYCHGATLGAGGTLQTPVWTTVDGTQAACGTCHGNPPTTNGHPNNPLCTSCHPATVGIDGQLLPGLHIDGFVDVAGLTCRSCHGSSANPAPPFGTGGETASTEIAVGAHQKHVVDGLIRGRIGCEECHVLPTELRHGNGVVDLAWGPLATTLDAAPTWDRAQATCASTYCHGAKLRTGGKTPTWTVVSPGQTACDSCHGAPPPAPHPASSPTGCGGCHPRTVTPEGAIKLAGGRHIDGTVDTGDCGECHGVPPANGAHQAHAAFPAPAVPPTPDTPQYGDLRILEAYAPEGGPAYRFGCGHCHPLDGAKHMDQQLQVELSPVGAPTGSLRARNSETAAYDRATGGCKDVYCHSSGQALPSFAVSPGWASGVKLGCAGCHGNPPKYPSGGEAAVNANSHIGLSDRGREFGHYAGLGGPAHASKHGSAQQGQAAAPITCQTCHYETTDPSATGPSTFYWLDTTGSYVLADGDSSRFADSRWKATQCETCHVPGRAPVGAGKVMPLRHVNGRRDVVFDPRTALPITALPPYTAVPPTPDTPTRPYWVTPARTCDAVPAGAVLDGATLSIDLSGAAYDATTKRCSGVACHLGDAPVWGRPYLVAPPSGRPSCCGCHSTRCAP